ncbi:hypothetical protein FW754_07875 [Acinetobacter sp. 1207_04]|uniref:phage tail fiber protein n=1 Tax=Acinetobacter sp. 1207_04 TaxID=2604449 RepID=UPI0040586D79
MAIQNITLGTAPTGAGGDTFRAAAVKLNENFTNNTHAASRLVGVASGNVMQVGALGLGGVASSSGFDGSLGGSFLANASSNNLFLGKYSAGVNIPYAGFEFGFQLGVTGLDATPNIVARFKLNNVFSSIVKLYGTNNTTIDSNGFIKNASPIVKLFADKIELNEEALEQEPLFEKVDNGHYLLKNTEGFSDNGWYIEMPKDANGNVLVAVQYQQIEDNTIEVKTFAKKFDEETGDIVPNLEKPRDIPTGRWIDIRLKELPTPEIEIPISNTPVEFQPTNLAQAVAEALKNGAEQ